MSDLHNFADLCANVIADVAAHLDAVEALASVEHTLPVLRGPYRYAGQAVARALYAVARHEEHPERDQVHDCLRWLRLAASWTRMGETRASWVHAGKCLERASAALDTVPPASREMREVMRAVIAAVEQVLTKEKSRAAA